MFGKAFGKWMFKIKILSALIDLVLSYSDCGSCSTAKKQRTIQVMELHDLPKQGLGNRNPQLRPGNYNRHWANGRR